MTQWPRHWPTSLLPLAMVMESALSLRIRTSRCMPTQPFGGMGSFLSVLTCVCRKSCRARASDEAPLCTSQCVEAAFCPTQKMDWVPAKRQQGPKC